MEDILTEHSYQVAKSRYFADGENCWRDVVNRIIGEISKIDKDQKFISEVTNSILNLEFLPGGRIIRNIGKLKGSMMNCNVVPIGDSIEEIGQCIKDSLTIWSYGGGVGINFSPLRPAGTKLTTKGGESSGLVSFLRAIDGLAETIESGGQRRAAGMAICDVSHPEIMEFIDVKLEHGLLSHFNLSVAVSADFLEAVEKNEDWDLKFSGRIYKTIKARDVWEKILTNMIRSAEPGLINWNYLTKNNTYYFSPIACTNPCGEQPLPNWGSCDLGSINLTKFVVGKSGSTNWKKLEDCIKTSVRLLDNIIDINYYPVNELELEAKQSRRIGLGVMGLGDYLIMKKIRYGSEKCAVELDKLFRFMRDKAYESSVELAQIKTPFPMFDKVAFGKASFIRKLPAKIRLLIKEKGIRNSNLLTMAPTGTTSLIANTTSGIEPVIFKANLRHDKVSDRIYIHPLYEKYLLSKINGEEVGEEPDYFVDIMDLTPEDHFEVQALAQRYIDSSISKTINLPQNIDSEKLSKLLLEYAHDLKGVTVYRDGSRDGQIYNRLSEEEAIKIIKDNLKTTGNLSKEDVKCHSGKCDL